MSSLEKLICIHVEATSLTIPSPESFTEKIRKGCPGFCFSKKLNNLDNSSVDMKSDR